MNPEIQNRGQRKPLPPEGQVEAEKSAWKIDLVLEAVIYVACLSLASFLWENPLALLMCLVVFSALMLWRWHQRSDVYFYVAGFVLGPLGEAMAVHFGAWTYGKPWFLVPIWLPCLWGIAALFVKRLCDTLLRRG